jgi:predicted phage terminase large subunit-like protein
LENPWIPNDPHPKQAEFLTLMDGSGKQPREAFYGGAAGGGKSEAILMSAAMYVDTPGYSALILRKNLPDLKQPGALIPRSKEWWSGRGATWNVQNKIWTFPSGAVIMFGYLEHDKDIDNYMGSEYQFIGYDEMTQFPLHHYTKLGTRLRRKKTMDVPLRIRGASNPGGIGHEWVLQHFMVEGPKAGRVFVPSKLEDNPSLDPEEYKQAFIDLDPVTRARWLDGDWTVMGGGATFNRTWFDIVEEYPAHMERVVRFWDTAATAPLPGRESEADWTVGTKIGRYQGEYFVLDVVRFQGTPGAVAHTIRQTAMADGYDVEIYMEQEPGASGVMVIDDYQWRILGDFNFQGIRSGSNKVLRANKLSKAAEAKKVKLARGEWISKWLNELEAFPDGHNDDQVDSAAGAYNQLTAGTEIRVASPQVERLFRWQG